MHPLIMRAKVDAEAAWIHGTRAGILNLERRLLETIDSYMLNGIEKRAFIAAQARKETKP